MIKVYMIGDKDEITRLRLNFETFFLTTSEPFMYAWEELFPRSETMCSYELEEVQRD